MGENPMTYFDVFDWFVMCLTIFIMFYSIAWYNHSNLLEQGGRLVRGTA